MANLGQVHQDIEAHIEAADLNGFKIAFENVDEIDRTNTANDALMLGTDNYIAFDVRHEIGTRISINQNPDKRELGILEVKIHVSQGTGVRSVYNVLDKLDVSVLHKTISGTYFILRQYSGRYVVGKWKVYVYQYEYQFCS